MAFRLSTPYYVLPGFQPEGTFGAILEMLLKARLDLQIGADSDLYDEDVNAYLGGVLVSYIDPAYIGEISDLLSKHDVDIHQAIDRAMPDRVQMYRIYKVNADDLLVSVGLFHRFWQQQKPQLVKIKQYYACASDCQRRIYGKPTALAEIQAKLSEGTERYLTILSQVRRDYLHFVQQVSDEELNDFFRPPLTP